MHEEVKIFKFSSNLQYASNVLKEKNIPHRADFEKLILFAESSEKHEIQKIISDLNLDEKDVEVNEQLLQGTWLLFLDRLKLEY